MTNKEDGVFIRHNYLAAWEFEYAAKLMPKKAIPLNNLGLVYERTGRLQRAAEAFEQALKREGRTVQVRANLARIYVRLDRKDKRTRELLEAIVREDDRREYIEWAQKQLMSMGASPIRPAPATSTAPAEQR